MVQDYQTKRVPRWKVQWIWTLFRRSGRSGSRQPVRQPHHVLVHSCHDVCRSFVPSSLLSNLVYIVGPSASFNVLATPPLQPDDVCPYRLSTHAPRFLQHNHQPLSKTTSTTTHNSRNRHHRSFPQRHRSWRPENQQNFVGSAAETPAYWYRDKMPGNSFQDSESQDCTSYIGREDRTPGHGRRQSCRSESREGKEEKG